MRTGAQRLWTIGGTVCVLLAAIGVVYAIDPVDEEITGTLFVGKDTSNPYMVAGQQDVKSWSGRRHFTTADGEYRQVCTVDLSVGQSDWQHTDIHIVMTERNYWYNKGGMIIAYLAFHKGPSSYSPPLLAKTKWLPGGVIDIGIEDKSGGVYEVWMRCDLERHLTVRASYYESSDDIVNWSNFGAETDAYDEVYPNCDFVLQGNGGATVESANGDVVITLGD